MPNVGVVDGSRTQVLVVDDNDDLCSVISELLAMSGYHTASAHDGSEALALLRDGLRPQLILLDRVIPVVDGPRFLDAAEEFLQGIPIVWMTGDEHIAVHPAVVGILRKPFELDELLEVVRAYVGSASPPQPTLTLV